MDNLNFILPEIFISLSIMFLLLLGVYKKNSSNIVHNLAVGSLLITGRIDGDSVDDIKKMLQMMLNDIDKHGVKAYGL